MRKLKINPPKKLEPFFKTPKRYNVLEGGRGGGKSHGVAEYFLALGMSDKYRFLCTREIQKSIKDSVYQLLSDKIREYNLPYEVKREGISCPLTGSEFFFHGLQDRTSPSLKSFEGADWCWVEEAQAISKKSLDILIPTIRKPGSKIVFTMNRLEESDPVYEKFCVIPTDDVLHIYINYYDNHHCPEKLKQEAERCKEIAYSDYLHIWEGQPMVQGDNKILSLAKVKQAMERTIEPEGGVHCGIDVARFGDDRTVITVRKGLTMLDMQTFTKLRTYETANHAIDMTRGYQDVLYKVDDTGVGGGVTDELVRKELLVLPVNNGQKALDPDKYPNAISEMWFQFRDNLDRYDLIQDQELLRELTGREYSFDNQARRRVEQKDKFKERYGRSPDKADSVLLAFYNISSTSGIV
jgi:phage terminase large subunit